ncbi:PREDICTED: uncharacterized protein LOC106751390 isoform X2 [Dinoponera quadriceps]|uniref:Uncharacterized protein LOC106751390 isoform X2 n=1 Tax=Dinoponera quadriceps TaxID=609295 RepID=A0A6P3Y9Z5_DINQU|nr:PREDICTED: uncharacterized protein LOC106751390 isoform X2 [Dinoponera quadriceps]
MEERQAENSIPVNLEDTNEVIASLEMLSVDTKCPSPTETKRVLRKRIPKLVSTEVSNRSRRPKKRVNRYNLEENIKEYYLDKNIKRQPNDLETIYEENDGPSDNSKYMSAKRFKRMLLFDAEPLASKLRKRRARIQKIFGTKVTKNYNKRRVSMQSVLDKLDGIRINSPAEIDIK